MSSPFWQRFPVQPGLHSLEMKDRLQKQVMEDTRGAAAAALVAYFREASRRFWRGVDHDYPDPVASSILVRDADQSPSSE
jgi:hypothetical protein